MCITKLLRWFKRRRHIEPVDENGIIVEENSNNDNNIIHSDNDSDNEHVDETVVGTNYDSNGETVDDINLGQSVGGMVVLVDNGHGNNTKGKRSPYSGYGVKPEIEFFEYLWNRQIARQIVERLEEKGYNAQLLVTEEYDVSLSERVKRVNSLCSKVGTKNVILISVHANAAGSGKEWKTARGWSAFTSKGNTKSDVIAEYLYAEAEKNFKGMKIRKDMSDGDKDWEENFTMTYNTYCPAVLTENFFYDNVDDVKYILSNEGREMVIKTHVDGIINYIDSTRK